MMASQNGHFEIVKMLLEGGADVNIQNNVRGCEIGYVLVG